MRVLRAKPGDWITDQIRCVTHAIVIVGEGEDRDEIAEKCLQVMRAERERWKRHRANRRQNLLDTEDGGADNAID